ncbi:MAG: hypothetical protein K2Y31_06600 [Burkholderiales bacterium]|jgi:hypothetical protein|nr:hypothetical protein [Burkholderiales bacterium]
MRKSIPLYSLLAGVMLASSAAIARLPPPTPEAQAAAEAKKAQEKIQLEKEKALLERVQDRIAQRYGDAGGRDAGKTRDENMPKTTKELPRDVGPKPNQPQSGEAHSAPAK